MKFSVKCGDLKNRRKQGSAFYRSFYGGVHFIRDTAIKRKFYRVSNGRSSGDFSWRLPCKLKKSGIIFQVFHILPIDHKRWKGIWKTGGNKLDYESYGNCEKNR